VLQADDEAFVAFQAIAGYNPANPAYRLEAVAAHNELRAQNTLAAARDAAIAAIAAQWEFHNLMLGVKDQVIAQYGADSDQVASLGLKKKSERKARVRAGKNST